MVDYDDISPGLKEKAMQCENPEELFELAKLEGIELTDEAIEQISGGFDWDKLRDNNIHPKK